MTQTCETSACNFPSTSLASCLVPINWWSTAIVACLSLAFRLDPKQDLAPLEHTPNFLLALMGAAQMQGFTRKSECVSQSGRSAALFTQWGDSCSMGPECLSALMLNGSYWKGAGGRQRGLWESGARERQRLKRWWPYRATSDCCSWKVHQIWVADV